MKSNSLEQKLNNHVQKNEKKRCIVVKKFLLVLAQVPSEFF